MPEDMGLTQALALSRARSESHILGESRLESARTRAGANPQGHVKRNTKQPGARAGL
jgi:hypothetical protein